MNGKTPISALQELMAARKLPLPVYLEEGFGISFKCTVCAGGITGVGTAANKKSAKHNSAENALAILGATTKVPTKLVFNKPVVTGASMRNYVGELNEFASKRGVQYPEYGDVTVTTLGEFYVKCSFIGKETFGKGMNKKDGKQNSAKGMLEIVSVMDPVKIISTVVQPKIEVETLQKDKIFNIFETLSMTDHKLVQPQKEDFKPVPGIHITPEDSIKVLETKLQNHGIEYTLQQFQRNPCIMMLQLKGTNLYFAGTGGTREEATREVLHDVLQAAKSGISLNTNDLMSFSS